MHGTIYYYYDKVLVTNCKLKTLKPYSGKIAQGCAVQLLVYSLETEHAPLSAPAGISADGDFYLAALSKNIIYQIHKNGTLIRAYAAADSYVEETITNMPMSVLAMLQGKLLLHGGVISVQDGVSVVLSEEGVWNDSGKSCEDTIPKTVIPKDTILLEEDTEGYKGILCSCSGNTEELHRQQPVSKLKGFLVLRHDGQKAEVLQYTDHGTGVTVITDSKVKEHLLLYNLVGFSMFSQELQEHICNSRFLKEAVRKVSMGVLDLSKFCKSRDDMGSYDLNILDQLASSDTYNL